RKLAPGGVLAFHVSNRYLKLAPLLGNLADDAKLAAIERYDSEFAEGKDDIPGKNSSHWVLLARQRVDFATVPDNPGWGRVGPPPGQALWTDDYSNLLSVYQWRD